MPNRNKPSSNAATLRACAWSGAALALIALVGLRLAPTMSTLWIAILVLAVASVPQAYFAVRREERKNRRDGR